MAAARSSSQPVLHGGDEEEKKEAPGQEATPPLPPSQSMPRVGFASAPDSGTASGEKRAAVLVRVMEEMRATAGPEASAELGKMGLELVVERLVSGGIFLKHSVNKVRSVAKHRVVWCSPDLRQLQWSTLDRAKVSQTIATAELVGVSLGAGSDVLKPLREKKQVKPERCLTLSFRSRTLDLECTSQMERDLWYLAFSHLQAYACLPADAQRESAVNQARKSLRGFSATTLAAEVETLRDQLSEAQTHVGRLQSALRKLKSDTTGEELLHPKLYRDKTQEEVQRLRQNLAATKAEANFLRDDNRRVKAELAKAAAELGFLKQLKDQGVDEQQAAERRQFEQEKATLKKELDLAVMRETVKTTADRESFVQAATSLPMVEVPVALIPAPAPEDEYSSSDDEEDLPPEVQALSVQERAARLVRKQRSDLVSCAVHVNQHEVECPRGEDRVDFYTDRLLAELVKHCPRGSMAPAAARGVIDALLRGVTETQLEGDAYGAVNWVAGHQELVVVTPDHSLPRALFFEVDATGVLLLSRHHFSMSDMKAAAEAGSSNDSSLVWLRCSAAYTRKVGYDREEVIAPRVLLSFHTGKPLTPEEQREAHAAAASAPGAVASSLLTRQMHEEAKTLSEADLHKVRTRERERVAEANASAKREDGLFVINNEWLTAWKKFLAGEPRPGPIDNAPLFEEDGTTVRDGLKPGRDYRALPKTLWVTLVDMYGGGPAVPRGGPNIYDVDDDEKKSADE